MLPFLKKSQESSALPADPVTRAPDDDSFDVLEVAAQDLIAAVESKNAKGVASALRAAFDLCEGEPHNEGPHNG